MGSPYIHRRRRQLSNALDPRVVAGSQAGAERSRSLRRLAGGGILLASSIFMSGGFAASFADPAVLIRAGQLDGAASLAAPVIARNSADDAGSAAYLQVAAYLRERDARALQRQLADIGLDQVVVLANLERKPVYRVRIGPLSPLDDAHALIARLDDLGLSGALLVQSSQAAPTPPAASIGHDVQPVSAAPDSPPAIAISVKRPAPVANERRVRLEQPERDSEPVAASSIQITRVTRSHPEATRRVMREGIAAMRAGALDTAERKFRHVLIAEPAQTQASIYLYTVLMEQGRIEAADVAAASGLEDGSDVAPLAKVYARSLLSRGDQAAALRVLEAYRPASSGDAEYAGLLAALLQKASRYAEAAQIYEHLLILDQQAGDWWAGLGIAHDGLGKRAEALYAFQRARDASTISTALAQYTNQRITELQADD